MSEPQPPIKTVFVAAGTGAPGIKQVYINLTGPTGAVQWPHWQQGSGSYPGNIPVVQDANAFIAGLENVVMPNYLSVNNTAQATAFLARASAAANLPVNATIYKYIINTLVNSGTWAKLDAFYYLGTASALADAKLNLVSTNYALGATGTVTWGPGVGVVSDGTSGALGTGFIPNAANGNWSVNGHSLGFLQQNQRRSAYVFSFSGSDRTFAPMGVINNAQTEGSYIYPIWDDGNCYLNMMGSTAQLSQTSTARTVGTRGVWIANRTSSTAIAGYFNNGVVISGTQTAAALADQQILILATNGASNATLNWCMDTIGCAFFGGALNAADLTVLTTVMNTLTSTNNVFAAANGYITKLFHDNLFNSIDLAQTGNSGFNWYTIPNYGYVATPSSDISVGTTGYTGFTGTYVQVVANTGPTGINSPTYLPGIYSAGCLVSAFTGSINSGGLLNVIAVQLRSYGTDGNWPITPGQLIYGSGMTGTVTVLPYGTNSTTGVGTTGTYALSGAASITAASGPFQGAAYVGNVFPFGGYKEATISFNPALAPAAGGNSNWPSFWWNDIQGSMLLNAVAKFSDPCSFNELDFFEDVPTASAGSPNPSFNSHYWINPIYGGTANLTSANNSSSAAQMGTPNFATNQVQIGCLVIPTTKGGGTGTIMRFIDGIHQPAFDVTYSSSGSPEYSPTTAGPYPDEGGFGELILNGGTAWPLTIFDVNIWG